jgi:hypothetical protein
VPLVQALAFQSAAATSQSGQNTLVFSVCTVAARTPALRQDTPHVPARAEKTDGLESSSSALAAAVPSLWQPGTMLRVLFLNGDRDLQRQVFAAAQEWSDHANIRFLVVLSGCSDIRVAFNPTGRTWSTLGTDALKVPQDQPTMNFEHQSPGAGIPWNRAEVINYYAALDPPWSEQEVETHIFQVASQDSTNFSQFDPKSIMCYPIPNEWTVGNFEVEVNEELSASDKGHIAKLYPPVPLHRCSTVPVNLIRQVTLPFRIPRGQMIEP